MPLERGHFELITEWVQGKWVRRRDLVAALNRTADQLEQQGGDVVQTTVHDPTEDGTVHDLRTNGP